VARRDELAGAAESLEAEAAAAELTAAAARDDADAAIVAMERAVAHADRVVGGISIFDVPATYARADLPAPTPEDTSVPAGGGVETSAEDDWAALVTTVPGQTEPPMPRLRPEPPALIQ